MTFTFGGEKPVRKTGTTSRASKNQRTEQVARADRRALDRFAIVTAGLGLCERDPDLSYRGAWRQLKERYHKDELDVLRFPAESTFLRWIQSAGKQEGPVELESLADGRRPGQMTKAQLIEELEDLRVREHRLRNIIENTKCGYFLIDKKGRFQEVNRAWLDMHGYDSAEEILGQHFALTQVDADIDAAIEVVEQIISGGGIPSGEFTRRCKDGSVGHHSFTAQPAVSGGDVVGLEGFLIDITERKRAEEALRESEKELRAILDSTVDGILVINDHGKAIHSNKHFAKLWRIPQELIDTGDERQLLDSIVEDLDDPDQFLAEVKRLNGSAESSLDTIRFRDGRIFERYSRPLLKGDLPAGRVWSFHDITERTRMEEALKESLDRLEAVIEGSRDAIFISDQSSRFALVNLAACQITGYSEEELLGMRIPDLHDGIDLDAYRTHHASIMAGQDALTEAKLLRRDGTKVVAEFNNRRIRIADTPFMHTVARDITERKRTEEEKLKLESRIQQAQKLESLGMLAGGIAHDFNNLLSVILGNADLALGGLSPHSPARDNIQEIEKASVRAAGLAKQMLAYSGKGRFVIEPIALGEFVEEMAHLLVVAISKSAVLKYNFADNLPTFDGDATEIRQIIICLITNASEAIGDRGGLIALSTGAMHCDSSYLAGGNPTVIVGLDESLVEGLYVYLEVSDTGCGMDSETISKVFDPFFTTKFTGRGLGLSATLGIVRGHKGAIKIYSEVGKGTTFKVLFPANELPENGAALEGGKGEGVATKWQGEGTVLVVDDEETVCATGRQMLERMGFTVLTAADGREAVEIFRDHSDEIVCVLLDLTMPHMDGEEAFGELRRIKPDVKALLCSGYNRETATQRFTGRGLAGFIQKPYRMAELREKLREILPAAAKGD